MTDYEAEFEEFFKRGCYLLRMSMFPPKTKVENFVKDLMREAFLDATHREREKSKKRIDILEKMWDTLRTALQTDYDCGHREKASRAIHIMDDIYDKARKDGLLCLR